MHDSKVVVEKNFCYNFRQYNSWWQGILQTRQVFTNQKSWNLMWGKIFECMIVNLWLKETFAIILDNTTIDDKGFSKQDN